MDISYFWVDNTYYLIYNPLMTVKELYIFAQSYNLLEENIEIVLNKYIKHISIPNNALAYNSTIDKQNNINISKSENDYKNKVEFSTEDVLKLFST